MRKPTSEVGEALQSAGRRAEDALPARKSTLAGTLIGLAAVAGVTAVAIRFFPDFRRYVRIKTM